MAKGILAQTPDGGMVKVNVKVQTGVTKITPVQNVNPTICNVTIDEVDVTRSFVSLPEIFTGTGIRSVVTLTNCTTLTVTAYNAAMMVTWQVISF